MVGEEIVESQQQIMIGHRMQHVEDDQAIRHCNRPIRHRQTEPVIRGEGGSGEVEEEQSIVEEVEEEEDGEGEGDGGDSEVRLGEHSIEGGVVEVEEETIE